MIQIFMYQMFYTIFTHLLGKYTVCLHYKDETREKNTTVT